MTLAENGPVPYGRLKLTSSFRAVYRRGRWVRGAVLSVGAAANTCGEIRIGLRTRKGIKGAAVRNRLKRQLRAIVFGANLSLPTSGMDVVIVIHPKAIPTSSDEFKGELLRLCRRIQKIV